MTIVVEQVAVLMLFGVIGFVLRRLELVDGKHAKILSTLCVYVFLPCQVFRTFSNNFNPLYLSEKYPLVLVSFAIVLVLAVAAHFASKLFSRDAFQQSVVKYSLTIPNYGYVGYAMAEGVFGSEMLLNVMMAAIPISLYTYTIGLCMLTRTKVSVKKLINPVNIAMVAGAIVGFFGIEIPNVLGQISSKAAGCVAPLGMILTGIIIAQYRFKVMLGKKQVYLITALRLLVIPLAVGGALKLIKLEQCLIPIVLLMCMPCGVNTVVFPKLIGEDCETGAALAFVTNILCCATIPLVFYIFGI